MSVIRGRGRWAAPAALVGVAAAVLAVLASRVRDWAVMTDELQYAKLATEFASGHVLPTLRGERVAAYGQVYPALISPLYGALSPPSAYVAAHALNGILFASAAIPAYLLGRQAALPRAWALTCAVVCVAVPWNVLASFVLSESAAYPVFLWALVAMLHALESPSPRRDALALAALALAFFTRTQFVVLALVFPLSVLVCDGVRPALRRHVLVETYAVAVVVAVVLAATGGIDRVLGRYSVTATQGSILPWRAIEQAGAHLDLVGLGLGLLPLLLGGAWVVVAAWRRQPSAVLALSTIVLLTLETSSYDVRFGNILRDRYVFYLAPLLVVAAARALRDGVHTVALAAVTVFVAVTVFAHEFRPIRGLYVDSPVTVLNGLIDPSGGAAFVALAAAVLALLYLRAPARVRVVGTAVLVLVVAAGTSATAWARLLTTPGPSGRPITGQPGLVLDWADRVLPHDADVGMIAYPTAEGWYLSAVVWWDVEFWNRAVDRAFVFRGDWEYAPFPHQELRVDERTGAIGAPTMPQYVIVASSDSRFRFAGPRVAQNIGLEILEPEVPWRAEWLTLGVDPDGWTREGRTATIRVFPKPGLGTERAQVRIQLTAPHQRRVGYTLAGKSGSLEPGGVVTEERDVCVAPGAYGELELETTRAAPIVGVQAPIVRVTRRAGPRIAAIAVLHTGEPC
jgi:hypothetical protein